MSDTVESLRRKIRSAHELQSVVRTMKAFAATSIGQYENAVRSLTDYHRGVELGLIACLRGNERAAGRAITGASKGQGAMRAIIFGSDQGLVGAFNDSVAQLAISVLCAHPGNRVWVVGERVRARLSDAGLAPRKQLLVPGSVEAITPLVREALIDVEADRESRHAPLWVFHNRPVSSSSYEPVALKLLPLDANWLAGMVDRIKWPSANQPQVMGAPFTVLSALIREYLFISLYRACAESLASENASRLAAMERADRNISELSERLQGDYHRVRQDGIDEELFDVISGFEASSLPA
ncbi:MAG TPA: F0F1 ATP synthase subunit gamma [Steroidobacteraceae bacterium]|nr:F0F1 ATP synthase subunit gamma [Steroidobacteraceae bacterium]